MNWRLLWLPTLLLLASRTFVEAQQAGKVSRVGWLSVSPEATFLARYNAFRQGLRDLGYVEGQNIVIEHRDAKGKLQRLPDAAAELVRCRRRLDDFTRTTVLRVKDGKIAEEIGLDDGVTALQQLGLIRKV